MIPQDEHHRLEPQSRRGQSSGRSSKTSSSAARLSHIFSDPFLRGELRFRGGTALNKLHFPAPLRYSEDIDLVRTTAGPIGPLLDRLHDILDPWLGKPHFDQSPVAPKLRYTVEAEDRVSPSPIRLKIEINTREREAYDPPIDDAVRRRKSVVHRRGRDPDFSREEMLATKLRALLQRNKGRDLFDLSHSLETFPALDTQKVVDLLGRYLGRRVSSFPSTSRAAHVRETRNPNFMADVRPLLAADASAGLTEEAARTAFAEVFFGIVEVPGEQWVRTDEMRERFGI